MSSYTPHTTAAGQSADTSSERRGSRNERDSGITLVEMLISMVITGTLITSLAFAFSVFLRTYPDTLDRVSVSKDVTFIQAWVPVDLASALEINAEPTHQPASYDLAGTNVMTITREDLSAPGAPRYLVNYRYQQVGTDWVLVRYEIRYPNNVGGTEEVKPIGVAHELATPPDGWDPDTAPTFAVDVLGRSPGELRKIGTDITIKFSSGIEFHTGGAGLGPGELLTPIGSDGFINPKSPPSRCGGRLTIVVDSSGSIGGNMATVNQNVKNIVSDFRGTPSFLRIIDFAGIIDDNNNNIPIAQDAIPLVPSTWNGAAVDMLNLDDAGRAAIDAKIDTIFARGGTNWEAALRMAMTDYSDLANIIPSPHMPDTVIFMTDGNPTIAIGSAGQRIGNGSAYTQEMLDGAKSISNMRGEWGVKIKGIFLTTATGSGADAEKARLKEVVGSTEWNAPTDGSVGNADAASFFTGNFAGLSNILKQIFVSECGGTVTVQHRLNGDINDRPTSGTYHYSTSVGDGDLRIANGQAITFDYEMGTGGSTWVPMTEELNASRPIVDVKCYSNGVEVPSRVRPITGNPIPNGREVQVIANDALSCLFIEQ